MYESEDIVHSLELESEVKDLAELRSLSQSVYSQAQAELNLRYQAKIEEIINRYKKT